MSFKDFRKDNNLSQKEICDYLCVSKAYISQCESGISRHTFATLELTYGADL